MQIRPATERDHQVFYGEMPKDTVRALVGEKDGRIVAFGGYYRWGGGVMIFCDIECELRPRDKVRGAHAIIGLARKLNVPIWAQSEGIGDTTLEHFGFRRMRGQLWRAEAWPAHSYQ